MSFLFSLSQRFKDNSTQMNFDEMVQFEGQAHGAYFTSVEQYLELAIDLAVRDTIKHQVYQGSLLRQNTVSSKIFYFYSLRNSISLGELLNIVIIRFSSCRPLTTPMKFTLKCVFLHELVISMYKGCGRD